ncbi:MAG: hypothetical protein L6Q77_09580 [Bacteroidetes bacterium]|nr:hypothetical protein [Bacteroidota bacterium]
MKRFFILIAAALIFSAESDAQVLKLVATDTFHGAGLGGLLWTGSAALGGVDNLDGLGPSVGAGILIGTGMGVFDSWLVLNNGNPYRNGILKSTGTSMEIVTMDSFYGGLIGGMVGVAAGLINSDSKFLNNVTTGYGYGVWAGMAFGIVDAVALASPSRNSGAVIEYQTDGIRIAGIAPAATVVPVLSPSGPRAEVVPSLSLLSVTF